MPQAPIKTVADRAKLAPSREPYWESIRRGCSLGFRKISTDSEGTWVARWQVGNQKKYEALGSFDELPRNKRRDAAHQAAEKWFKHVAAGGSTDATTVATACRLYVDHVRSEKGDTAADELDMRFGRWVRPDKIADVDVTKLQPQQLLDWRKRLTVAPVRLPGGDDAERRARAKGTINRDLTALRAALNFARSQRVVMNDEAWRETLKPHKAADGRRELYLDRKHRQAWIERAGADVGRFLRALSLIPLRPGALALLDVADLDKRTAALKVGKDKAGGDRWLPLPPATAAFFLEQATDALPSAPLLRRADGARWNKDSWYVPVREAAVAAGLPRAVSAYTMRHSVITDLVHAGLDTLTVAQLSGTSVAMIEKHYGHLRAEHARAALATLA